MYRLGSRNEPTVVPCSQLVTVWQHEAVPLSSWTLQGQLLTLRTVPTSELGSLDTPVPNGLHRVYVLGCNWLQVHGALEQGNDATTAVDSITWDGGDEGTSVRTLIFPSWPTTLTAWWFLERDWTQVTAIDAAVDLAMSSLSLYLK